MLDKTFHPAEVEDRLYAMWESSGAFRAGERPGAPTFCVVIPPPNVTGSLHIGHALNNTLQDALCRFERMRGKDVLWQPGTDHAGIATQLVVERELAKRQMSRIGMGRDAFLAEVWKWKEESGGTIVRQLRKLGASCDWSRERFTMDEGLSRAVLKVFVGLYKEGLIYKDKRLVNWDPRLQTAVSDLEVESIELDGHLWHIKYPIAGEEGRFITVATTRPETMLGDTAVAVHPDDERYKDLVGKNVVLPLADRPIPIIADEYSDPEKGSGAVKITPGHDFNDFEVGKRHGLPLINILTADAKLDDAVPEAYRGLDRFKAREKVVADLEALGLLEKVEKIRHAIPHDEKTKTVVLEPYLTEQWYLNVTPLAEKAIAAVENGRTRFVPEQWTNVYYSWMRNIQPWCISRQLWWGHQIPAWYHFNIPTDDGGRESPFKIDIGALNAPYFEGVRDQSQHLYVVAETENEALAVVQAKYPHRSVVVVRSDRDAIALFREGKVGIWRDEDVLDTWFSSALWPFSTLGWPEETPELKRYYPTSVLVTAFDIIFFWVARMMMMGLHFMGEVPFRHAFIHNRVLDEKGQKMSKVKGNVVDPLDLISEYGADALRFALALACGHGRDMRIGTSRVETCRNFGTKLWNAARFCEMNQCVTRPDFRPSEVRQTVNRWILGETARVTADVTAGIEAYRFNDAAGAIYHFVYDVFCDWYLEFSKPVLNGTDEAAKAETRATAAFVRDRIVQLLHPFMPFITEELWMRTAPADVPREKILDDTAWPDAKGLPSDAGASTEMEWVIGLVTNVRSVRTEMNVPPSQKIPLIVKGASPESQARLRRHGDLILTLARLSETREAAEFPSGSAQFVVGEATAALPLEGVIDLGKERARLQKEVAKQESEIAKIDAKLSNQAFVSRAPEEVIEEQKERKAEADAIRIRLNDALRRLS
jgi:valyl-tRNA synthetase